MSHHITGTFDVKLAPETVAGRSANPTLGQMSLDKVFHGDLNATSTGSMLTGMTAVTDSAGYVAIEKVTGTLNGRKGAFILQHSGIMNRGTPSLSVVVIPDSGSDELTGLNGTLNIRMEDGKHFYDFDYTLP